MTARRSSAMYMVYVDDSGEGKREARHDHDLLGALCIPVESWSAALNEWKRFRRWTRDQFAIPLDHELHAVEIAGHADLRIATADGNELVISPRQQLSSGKVLTRAEILDRAMAYAIHKDARLLMLHAPVKQGTGNLYPALLSWLEKWLTTEDSYGQVWFDGVDPHLEEVRRTEHRRLKLDDRRVIEDPVPRKSEMSHFIQMIDFCAYAAFKTIRRDENGETRDIVGNAYQRLLTRNIVVAGGYDRDGFPAIDNTSHHGIRGYNRPPRSARRKR